MVELTGLTVFNLLFYFEVVSSRVSFTSCLCLILPPSDLHPVSHHFSLPVALLHLHFVAHTHLRTRVKSNTKGRQFVCAALEYWKQKEVKETAEFGKMFSIHEYFWRMKPAILQSPADLQICDCVLCVRQSPAGRDLCSRRWKYICLLEMVT